MQKIDWNDKQKPDDLLDITADIHQKLSGSFLITQGLSCLVGASLCAQYPQDISHLVLVEPIIEQFKIEEYPITPSNWKNCQYDLLPLLREVESKILIIKRQEKPLVEIHHWNASIKIVNVPTENLKVWKHNPFTWMELLEKFLLPPKQTVDLKINV